MLGEANTRSLLWYYCGICLENRRKNMKNLNPDRSVLFCEVRTRYHLNASKTHLFVADTFDVTALSGNFTYS
jgi:hypothetical protein